MNEVFDEETSSPLVCVSREEKPQVAECKVGTLLSVEARLRSVSFETLGKPHARKHETHPPRVKKKEEEEFRLDSNDCGFICAGVNFVGGYK